MFNYKEERSEKDIENVSLLFFAHIINLYAKEHLQLY